MITLGACWRPTFFFFFFFIIPCAERCKGMSLGLPTKSELLLYGVAEVVYAHDSASLYRALYSLRTQRRHSARHAAVWCVQLRVRAVDGGSPACERFELLTIRVTRNEFTPQWVPSSDFAATILEIQSVLVPIARVTATDRDVSVSPPPPPPPRSPLLSYWPQRSQSDGNISVGSPPSLPSPQSSTICIITHSQTRQHESPPSSFPRPQT